MIKIQELLNKQSIGKAKKYKRTKTISEAEMIASSLNANMTNHTLTKYKSIREIEKLQKKKSQNKFKSKITQKMKLAVKQENKESKQQPKKIINSNLIEIYSYSQFPPPFKKQSFRFDIDPNTSQIANKLNQTRKKKFSMVFGHSLHLNKCQQQKRINVFVKPTKFQLTTREPSKNTQIIMTLRQRPKSAYITHQFLGSAKVKPKLQNNLRKTQIMKTQLNAKQVQNSRKRSLDQENGLIGWEIKANDWEQF